MEQLSKFSPAEADAQVQGFVEDGTLTLQWKYRKLNAIWRFGATTSDKKDVTVPFPMEVVNDKLTGRIYDYVGEGSTLAAEITDAANRYAYALLNTQDSSL